MDDGPTKPMRGRYARQEVLPGFGPESTVRLGGAHAAIVGVGALGTVSAELLARAGVGRLTLIDRDTVEATNLQRQTLFSEAHAARGEAKATAAAEALGRINSGIIIHAHTSDFTHANAERLLGLDGSGSGGAPTPDVLIDGTDNFETRFLLNDLSVKHAVPYVYAGAVGTRGMLMTVLPAGGGSSPWEADASVGAGPCLRCVLGDAPPTGSSETCDTAGVLGPVTAATASFQAVEAIKVLLGRFDLLRRHLLAFDPWRTEFSRVDAGPAARSAGCACCGERRFEHLQGGHARDVVVLCGRDDARGAVQLAPTGACDLATLAASLERAGHGPVQHTAVFVRAQLASERAQLTVFADGRTVVHGTNDPARARSIQARFVG
jgi:adenylyltransferase/sulfurtransferase